MPGFCSLTTAADELEVNKMSYQGLDKYVLLLYVFLYVYTIAASW